MLAVPSLACPLERFGVATERAFDAWGWCASDVIEWRTPIVNETSPVARASRSGGDLVERSRAASRACQLDKSMTIDAENPADLVFVFREGADSTFLPRELACLHAKGYELAEEWALAPYAIDDATDLLYERGQRPGDTFWLAAGSLRALVWGLHDWVHFHNHGPFDEPALTELACDVVALEWLRSNRETIGLTDDDLARVAGDLRALSLQRFVNEGKPAPDLGAW